MLPRLPNPAHHILPILSPPVLAERHFKIIFYIQCCRFGTVKAVNVVKQGNCSSTTESFASMDAGDAAVDDEGKQEVTVGTTAHELENLDESKPPSSTMEAVEDNCNSDVKPGRCSPLSSSTDPDDFSKANVDNGHSDDKLLANIITDETCESNIEDKDTSIKDAGSLENLGSSSGGREKSPDASIDHLISNDKVVDNSTTVASGIEDTMKIEKGSSSEEDITRTSASALNPGNKKDSDINEKAEDKGEVANLGKVFKPGSVLVEFKRAEACCIAAHCLHRRHFDDRIVTVEYISPNLYRKRFPK